MLDSKLLSIEMSELAFVGMFGRHQAEVVLATHEDIKSNQGGSHTRYYMMTAKRTLLTYAAVILYSLFAHKEFNCSKFSACCGLSSEVFSTAIEC